MAGARITGYGTALPERVVTNDDLSRMVDTTDEWIVERTGIRERRIGGTTAGLATEAATAAMKRAGVSTADIDLIILATTTEDRQVPATASTVQEALGARCGAFDLNAACSGFVYGLVAAHGFIGQGMRRVLVIGSETLSKIVDWTDRSTCILFADGAGAVVVEATDGPDSLLGWHLDSDGSAENLLYAERDGYLVMAGREVFRRAVLVMEHAARQAMAQAGVTEDDVDVVIPHQANSRIIDASCRRLGIPTEKAISVLHNTGNTSSASIPLALAEGIESDRVHDGDLVLMVGFGAGMTSASALLRWGGG
jgi:3-oxoacyl-[acyl-carrier-protein] synthase III